MQLYKIYRLFMIVFILLAVTNILGVMRGCETLKIQKRIEKLEAKVAFYDTVFNTRKWVDSDHFAMLVSQVAWNSTFLVDEKYWRSVELDTFRNYFERWGFTK